MNAGVHPTRGRTRGTRVPQIPFRPGVTEYARWQANDRYYRVVHVGEYAPNGMPWMRDEVHRWDPASELWQRTDLVAPFPSVPEPEPRLRPVPARAVFTPTTIRLKRILGWSLLAPIPLTMLLVMISLDAAEVLGRPLIIFFDVALPLWLLWSLWMWFVRWGAARAGVDPSKIMGEPGTMPLQ